MTVPYFTNAFTFLISTLFGLYILAVLLRFLLQLARADFYNPISQFIVTITNPPLRFLRRFIPGFAGIDWAAIILLLALQALEVWLVYWLNGHSSSGAGIALMAVAELLKLTVYVFIVAILIQVVLSWVAPTSYNPMSYLLRSLNEPLLGPARRLLPPIAGLDLSPIAVLIALQLIFMLIVAPLQDLARGLL